MQNFEEPFHYNACHDEGSKMARVLHIMAGIRKLNI